MGNTAYLRVAAKEGWAAGVESRVGVSSLGATGTESGEAAGVL